MDTLKSYMGGDDSQKSSEGNKSGDNKDSGSGGGFMDKVNSMAGGGAQGEKNEDGLDKGTYLLSFALLSCAHLCFP